MNETKFRVLVFPCGSEVGLEIYHALKFSRHVELYGASSVPSNHGKYVYNNYVEGLPYVGEQGFIEGINDIVDEHKIDYIFPAHDSVIIELSEKRAELHAKIVTSQQETCTVCRSKMATYEKFNALIPVPEAFNTEHENIKFPVFLKPDIGQGSKGTHLADSRKEMEFYLSKDASLLILEYLPGKEYTVDCFSDRSGNLRFAGARERIRIMNGISVDTKPVFDDEFTRIAEIINYKLCFRGAWFFQLKENKNGELALLEIAPRIAGSMGLYRNLGINFPLLSLYDAANLDIEIVLNEFDVRMDRALYSLFKTDIHYDNVYVDFDDCLILEGSVNPKLIAFLYQCFNNGKKLHLLTRHGGDLSETLHTYRLDSLFDTITHLDKGDFKSRYIKGRKAIFIDDSFSERFEIKTALGIPVFAPDAIECLMRW